MNEPFPKLTVGAVLANKHKVPVRKLWMGSKPDKCEGCERPFMKVFYDMRTVLGPWAKLCPDCAFDGIGIGETGTGKGQRYERVFGDPLKWIKTGG